jgi:hypothetical protein
VTPVDVQLPVLVINWPYNNLGDRIKRDVKAKLKEQDSDNYESF